MRVLHVEDDQQTADYLNKGLTELGHVVDHAADGKQGWFLASEFDYDVMIIDRMLPGLSGTQLIQRIRERHIDTPIIILSALSSVDDRVTGLQSGSDDYLTKPFAFAELQARLDAIVRRHKSDATATTLTVADLTMELLTHQVSRNGQTIELQPREFKLLEYLMRHAGQVVTRVMLLEEVWDYKFDPQTNVIDVHISRLRSKIDKNFDQPLLHTVRGAGYCLRQ